MTRHYLITIGLILLAYMLGDGCGRSEASKREQELRRELEATLDRETELLRSKKEDLDSAAMHRDTVRILERVPVLIDRRLDKEIDRLPEYEQEHFRLLLTGALRPLKDTLE